MKNNIDTGWLDRIILEGGIKVALVLGKTSSCGSRGDATMTSISGGSGKAANGDTLVIIGVTVLHATSAVSPLINLETQHDGRSARIG